MPYLEKCLESLRRQTIQDIEIICVNDCSPDNSREFVENVCSIDSRVKLINHDGNKRQGGAWNSGVRLATGTFLSFVDADDWVDVEYSSIVLSHIDSDIICAEKYFQGNSVTDNINNKRLIECNGNICKYQLLNGLSFITNFYRRSFITNLGFEFLENNMYQDFITSLLYFKTKKIEFYTQPGYHYRTDNISIQRSMNQNGFWGRLEVAKLERRLLLEIIETEGYLQEIDYHFYILFYRNTLTRAFFGYSTINWDMVNNVMEDTEKIVPNITLNKYYKNRFRDYSCLMRLPIIMFEHLSFPLVNAFHKIYMMARKVLKWNKR